MVRSSNHRIMHTIELYVRDEREKALLVARELTDRRDTWVWLPKSQIEYSDDFEMGEKVTFIIPEWLVREKDLLDDASAVKPSAIKDDNSSDDDLPWRR